jgi:O-antigen ligase
MTKSRISLLSLSAMLGILALVGGFRILHNWMKRLFSASRGIGWVRSMLASGISLVLLLVICGILAFGLLWGMTKLDPRLSGLFQVGARVTELHYFYPQDVIYALGGQLTLAERFIYWTTAFRIFGTYPILGVGPGNAGFLFESFMPVYGFQLIEIQNVLNQPIYGFPNPKSLWLRILAEQGIIGMIAFVSWLLLLGLSAWALLKSRDRVDRFIGTAGMLWLVAQLFEGFSLDTYALPQLWIVPGLLSAWATRRLFLSGLRAGKPG